LESILNHTGVDEAGIVKGPAASTTTTQVPSKTHHAAGVLNAKSAIEKLRSRKSLYHRRVETTEAPKRVCVLLRVGSWSP
jgi:hypothetical protein